MPGSELRGFNLKRNRKKRWVAPYGTFNPEFSPQGVRLTMQVMNSHDRIMQVDREPNRPRNLKFGLLQYRVGDRTLDPNAIMQPNHRTATRSCLEFPKEGHHEPLFDLLKDKLVAVGIVHLSMGADAMRPFVSDSIPGQFKVISDSHD